jgi:hypothetical protein
MSCIFLLNFPPSQLRQLAFAHPAAFIRALLGPVGDGFCRFQDWVYVHRSCRHSANRTNFVNSHPVCSFCIRMGQCALPHQATIALS